MPVIVDPLPFIFLLLLLIVTVLLMYPEIILYMVSGFIVSGIVLMVAMYFEKRVRREEKG